MRVLTTTYFQRQYRLAYEIASIYRGSPVGKNHTYPEHTPSSGVSSSSALFIKRPGIIPPYLFPINRHYRKCSCRRMAHGVGLLFPDKRKPLVYRQCCCSARMVLAKGEAGSRIDAGNHDTLTWSSARRTRPFFSSETAEGPQVGNHWMVPFMPGFLPFPTQSYSPMSIITPTIRSTRSTPPSQRFTRADCLSPMTHWRK